MQEAFYLGEHLGDAHLLVRATILLADEELDFPAQLLDDVVVFYWLPLLAGLLRRGYGGLAVVEFNLFLLLHVLIMVDCGNNLAIRSS